MTYLLKNKILVQQHYIPIYKFKVYKQNKNSFVGSEKFFKNSISLPIYVDLNQTNQNIVIKKIKSFLKKE